MPVIWRGRDDNYQTTVKDAAKMAVFIYGTKAWSMLIKVIDVEQITSREMEQLSEAIYDTLADVKKHLQIDAVLERIVEL